MFRFVRRNSHVRKVQHLKFYFRGCGMPNEHRANERRKYTETKCDLILLVHEEKKSERNRNFQSRKLALSIWMMEVCRKDKCLWIVCCDRTPMEISSWLDAFDSFEFPLDQICDQKFIWWILRNLDSVDTSHDFVKNKKKKKITTDRSWSHGCW